MYLSGLKKNIPKEFPNALSLILPLSIPMLYILVWDIAPCYSHRVHAALKVAYS